MDTDELKQAKVIEFLSTKTIDYIDDLQRTGDNKYYHFHKQLDAYFERAKARITLNNIVDAHFDLDEILLRDPEYWNAYYYKGKLFSMIRDYEAALPYLEIAIENGLKLTDLFLLRGIARFEEGTMDMGLSDFEKLLDANNLSDIDRFTVLFYYSKF